MPAALSTGCGCPNCCGRLRKLGEDVAEPNRRGEHPRRHLWHFHGVLQAGAYSGFDRLYEPEHGDVLPRVREAGCWAHVRRKF